MWPSFKKIAGKHRYYCTNDETQTSKSCEKNCRLWRKKLKAKKDARSSKEVKFFLQTYVTTSLWLSIILLIIHFCFFICWKWWSTCSKVIKNVWKNTKLQKQPSPIFFLIQETRLELDSIICHSCNTCQALYTQRFQTRESHRRTISDRLSGRCGGLPAERPHAISASEKIKLWG